MQSKSPRKPLRPQIGWFLLAHTVFQTTIFFLPQEANKDSHPGPKNAENLKAMCILKVSIICPDAITLSQLPKSLGQNSQYHCFLRSLDERPKQHPWEQGRTQKKARRLSPQNQIAKDALKNTIYILMYPKIPSGSGFSSQNGFAHRAKNAYLRSPKHLPAAHALLMHIAPYASQSSSHLNSKLFARDGTCHYRSYLLPSHPIWITRSFLCVAQEIFVLILLSKTNTVCLDTMLRHDM
jgi:hypothetical protein